MANELKDEAEAEPWAYRCSLPCSQAQATQRQEWLVQGDLIGVTAGAQLRSIDRMLICKRWARHFRSPKASTGRYSISPPICPHPHSPLARDTGETVTVNSAKLAVRGSLELTCYPAVHSEVRKLKTKTLHGIRVQILLRATLHNLYFRYFHTMDRNAELSTSQLGRNIGKCQTKTHIRAYPSAEQAYSKEQMTHIQSPNTQMGSYGGKEQSISKLPKHSAQTVGCTHCGTRTHRSL